MVFKYCDFIRNVSRRFFIALKFAIKLRKTTKKRELFNTLAIFRARGPPKALILPISLRYSLVLWETPWLRKALYKSGLIG